MGRKLYLSEDCKRIEYPYLSISCYTWSDKVVCEGLTYEGRRAKPTEIEIPEGVQVIKDSAFLCYGFINKVSLPNSLITIGDSAFESCDSLESIVIPDNVTFIGDLSFYGCTNLKTVKLSSSLRVIDFGAFANCESLDDVIIPNSVTDIGKNAFRGCSSLESVTFEEGRQRNESFIIEKCFQKTPFAEWYDSLDETDYDEE